MAETNARSYGGQQPGAEMWRRTLARIPTVFGRLAFVAALWDGGSGRYVHPALTQTFGADDADRILSHSHHQMFSQWLAASLEDQKSDLDDFFRQYGAPRRSFKYRDLIPPHAREVERQLYITDLEILLELLEFEQDGALPSSAAWRRP